MIDHTTCWTIIMAITTALLAVTGWGVKKDNDYKRVVEERVKNAEKRAATLEGLFETRHQEGGSA